ncbi:MAG: hypothetical protein ACXIUP_10785, partial [Microcella sp.]
RDPVDSAVAAAVTERLGRIAALSGIRAERAGDHVTLHVRLGDGLNELLAALSRGPVVDLVIAEPDLERTVLGFYGDHADTEGADR